MIMLSLSPDLRGAPVAVQFAYSPFDAALGELVMPDVIVLHVVDGFYKLFHAHRPTLACLPESPASTELQNVCMLPDLFMTSSYARAMPRTIIFPSTGFMPELVEPRITPCVMMSVDICTLQFLCAVAVQATSRKLSMIVDASVAYAAVDMRTANAAAVLPM